MCVDTLICLDALHIWMPPVHTQHKESMLCHTKGCPYAPMCGHPLYVKIAPCMFECLHICGHPLYVWMLPVCLDALMFGHPPYVWMPPNV